MFCIFFNYWGLNLELHVCKESYFYTSLITGVHHHDWHRSPTSTATPPILFCSGYFGDRVLLLALAGPVQGSTIYSSHHNWDNRHMPTQLFSISKKSYELFLLPRLASNCDPSDLRFGFLFLLSSLTTFS
jgi:hypothetical protein